MSGDGSFPARFGTVAIVGVGLIGGSLGLALRQRRLAHRVIGVGRDLTRLETAVKLGAIDDATTQLQVALSEADLVVLCTTVGHIIETVGDVTRQIKPNCVVTDVGSTKAAIVAQAAGCSFFVGGHPMAGSERGGVEAATATLYQEATWAITPTPETEPHALETVRALAQEVGATTLIIAPEAHDAMVAVTSHLPHVMASALMRLATTTRALHPETARLSAGSFADATRVAASHPSIWRDVCLTNRDAVLTALSNFRVELDVLTAAVESSDPDAIEAFFAAGTEARASWPGR